MLREEGDGMRVRQQQQGAHDAEADVTERQVEVDREQPRRQDGGAQVSGGSGCLDHVLPAIQNLRMQERTAARGNDSSNSSSVCGDSTSMSSSSAASSPRILKHAASSIEVLELLHEELKLEIAPRKVLRQFSLNIPPSSSAPTGASSEEDFRSAVMSRNFLQHGSPTALGDVLERWEKNHVKWRHHGSSSSLVDLENHQPHDGQLMVSPLPAAVPRTALSQAAGPVAFESWSERVPYTRNETFEVQFGHGFLGLEFVINETRKEVVVKSVQADAWQANTLQVPPNAAITRGLIVDAINGHEVGVVSPEEILDMLQYTARPLTVRFRKSGYSVVVCKLCECKVDAATLDEHTNYCVMSKRFELEADQINNTLTKVAASIKTNLQADSMRACFHPEDLHFYNALRVVAIQEPESSSFAVDRGLKYLTSIRNLIYAKMSKMRATQKVMLQQGPPDLRLPFHRTKSLEEKENIAPRASVSKSRRQSVCRVSIRDFQIVKPISKGAFGKVYLARKKTTGDQYAIKVLAKEHLLRKKQQLENIETERDILVNIESPFVVKLFWTFQTNRNLFLVMEYLPGGDFMSLLECIVQLEEQLTDFGLSEEAVNISDSESEAPDEGFFGEGNFLGDDIPAARPDVSIGESPEQFGFDENISAFFDASRPPRRNSKQKQKEKQKKKQAHPHTYGRCGTPDYLSPEIVLGVQHGPPVDYWALGIILYEMLVGFPPFNDDTVEAIFNNILERQILWPDGEKCLSPDAIDLISKLLELDPALRLDWEGLTRHRFFEGIDWDTLLDSIPPFVPTLEGPNDTSYFNNRNLTDIFIDDDEFDFDAKSVDSSAPDTVEAVGAGDELFSNDDKGESTVAGEQEDEGGGGSESSSDTASDSASGVGGDRVVELGAKNDQDVVFGDILQSGEYVENNNFKFPSGMYDTSDDASMSEVFRSFSYTNMNALAAASRTEAELITDTHLLEVENSSSLSILI